MKKGIVKKILLGFLGLLALLVIVFVVSCNVRLPELEKECIDMANNYIETAYKIFYEHGYPNDIPTAINIGDWDYVYEKVGNGLRVTGAFSSIEKQFLKYSSNSTIKKLWQYL